MEIDRNKIARDLRQRRKECGWTIEKMIEIIGDDRISLKTYIRIEQGDPSVSKEKLGMVVHALGMDPFDYFTGEDIFYACLDDSVLEKRLAAQKIMFPADSMRESNYSIRNIPAFLVHLPLMDYTQIIDLLIDIQCSFVGNEEAVCDCLQKIIDTIPDSPAKKWTDLLCDHMSNENQNLLASTHSKVRKQQLQNFLSTEESFYCKEQYYRVLSTYKYCLPDENKVSSYRIGRAEESVRSVEHLMQSLRCDEAQACSYLGKSIHQYREDEELLKTVKMRGKKSGA